MSPDSHFLSLAQIKLLKHIEDHSFWPAIFYYFFIFITHLLLLLFYCRNSVLMTIVVFFSKYEVHLVKYYFTILILSQFLPQKNIILYD